MEANLEDVRVMLAMIMLTSIIACAEKKGEACGMGHPALAACAKYVGKVLRLPVLTLPGLCKKADTGSLPSSGTLIACKAGLSYLKNRQQRITKSALHDKRW